MKKIISLRKRLQQGKIILGSWLQMGSPVAAEILARLGYEWLGIDCEHTDTSLADVTAMCRAVQGFGTGMLVRVRECDTLAIRQALDVGAEGVIVPLVSTSEEASRAVAAAKYPPRGIRGYCFGRMNNWGMDFDKYAASANEKTVVIVMIESAKAVDNIKEILAVDGVDGIFIGPYDLSGSYGVSGQTNHPKVMAARRRVLEACASAGKPAGIHLVKASRQDVRRAVAEGFRFICIDADIIFLSQAGDILASAKKAVLAKRSP